MNLNIISNIRGVICNPNGSLNIMMNIAYFIAKLLVLNPRLREGKPSTLLIFVSTSEVKKRPTSLENVGLFLYFTICCSK